MSQGIIVIKYAGEDRRESKSPYATWINYQTGSKWSLLKSNQENNADPGATWKMRLDYNVGLEPKYWIEDRTVADMLKGIEDCTPREWDQSLWRSWDHFLTWARGYDVDRTPEEQTPAPAQIAPQPPAKPNGRYNKIGRTATTIANDGAGSTVVTYHSTRIVVFNEEQITLTSGGYFTKTTKQRFNEVATVFNLGFQVWQVKGLWRIEYDNKTYDYKDGMILDRETGKVYANRDMRNQNRPMITMEESDRQFDQFMAGVANG